MCTSIIVYSLVFSVLANILFVVVCLHADYANGDKESSDSVLSAINSGEPRYTGFDDPLLYSNTDVLSAGIKPCLSMFTSSRRPSTSGDVGHVASIWPSVSRRHSDTIRCNTYASMAPQTVAQSENLFRETRGQKNALATRSHDVTYVSKAPQTVAQSENLFCETRSHDVTLATRSHDVRNSDGSPALETTLMNAYTQGIFEREQTLYESIPGYDNPGTMRLPKLESRDAPSKSTKTTGAMNSHPSTLPARDLGTPFENVFDSEEYDNPGIMRPPKLESRDAPSKSTKITGAMNSHPSTLPPRDLGTPFENVFDSEEYDNPGIMRLPKLESRDAPSKSTKTTGAMNSHLSTLQPRDLGTPFENVFDSEEYDNPGIMRLPKLESRDAPSKSTKITGAMNSHPSTLPARDLGTPFENVFDSEDTAYQVPVIDSLYPSDHSIDGSIGSEPYLAPYLTREVAASFNAFK